ncbi:MAG: MATE family efflux transporter [Dehalococcoidales bacterium]|nr:MATE family efflux transporter [Dehalococcoidales bacterium]
MARSRDWTKGSTGRNLLVLSWPVWVHEVFFQGTQILDMIWVGRLGVASVAGLGVATIVIRVGNSAVRGLSIGARAMVARFVGAGDDEGAIHAARQVLIVSAAFGTVMAAIAVPLAGPVLRFLGLMPEVVAEGTLYLRIMFLSWIPYSLWMVAYGGILHASGDTVNPMRITIFIRSVWMVLSPSFIFGWWIFPRLGVAGAAMATLVSQCLAIALALWVLFSGKSRLKLTLEGLRFDTNIIWRAVKVSLPAAVQDMQRSFGNLVLTRLMIPFGTVAVAAHSLANRVDMMISPVNIALGRGAGVLVGQNLGAGYAERAERSGWLGAAFNEVFVIGGSVVILLWAEGIVRLFSSDPELVGLTAVFLRIAAAGYLVNGFEMILQQSIASAGDTVPPLLVSLVTIWLVQLPLAFLLPRVTALGVYGVRWAMVISLVLGAIVYSIYFRLGRWKRKKL